MTGDEPTTFEIDGPAALERRLASITAAKREASRIRSRIAEVEAELESLDAEYGAAVQRLEGEEADVRKLAGFSFTGLIADLRGSREEALEREIAEAAAARLEVATLLERQDAEVRELSSLQDRLVALGDPDVEWQDALADRERWVEVHGGETAERLTRIATEMRDLDDEMRECEEAREVAGEALSRLDGVAEALGAAEDWSGFDTWFGGGVFTRSEKHDQLDEASRRIHEAEDSLRRFGARPLHAVAGLDVDLGNAIVVEGEKVLNPTGLRHDDEFIRHKMLDALGDLALAGAPILGHYRGRRAGHASTNLLLRKLFATPMAYEMVTCDATMARKLPGVGVKASDLVRVA